MNIHTSAGFVPVHRYGVIGDPVAHSLSPALHNAAFKLLGLPGSYAKYHVLPEELELFIMLFRRQKHAYGRSEGSGDLWHGVPVPGHGLSVTLPHKKRLPGLADIVAENAVLCGAANTLYWRGDALAAENTDMEGFFSPLDGRRELRSALILGAGGAAAACLAALMQAFDAVFVSARRREQAEELIDGTVRGFEKTGRSIKAMPVVLPYDVRQEADADLIVNTIPASLAKEPFSPYDFDKTRRPVLAYDLMYAETPFLADARRHGVETLNGRPMFLAQGAAQFRLWTGREMPSESAAALEPMG
ncbi:MAG: shikimate dehydrogenase [Mailhella sp.]|nr:shikimate dehydrogenase [Mailhella sp.]